MCGRIGQGKYIKKKRESFKLFMYHNNRHSNIPSPGQKRNKHFTQTVKRKRHNLTTPNNNNREQK